MEVDSPAQSSTAVGTMAIQIVPLSGILAHDFDLSFDLVVHDAGQLAACEQAWFLWVQCGCDSL